MSTTLPNDPQFIQLMLLTTCKITNWYDIFITKGHLTNEEVADGMILHNTLKKLLTEHNIDYTKV